MREERKRERGGTWWRKEEKCEDKKAAEALEDAVPLRSRREMASCTPRRHEKGKRGRMRRGTERTDDARLARAWRGAHGHGEALSLSLSLSLASRAWRGAHGHGERRRRGSREVDRTEGSDRSSAVQKTITWIGPIECDRVRKDWSDRVRFGRPSRDMCGSEACVKGERERERERERCGMWDGRKACEIS